MDCLGIDLGTTNSCMALLEDGRPVVLENSEKARTTPSVVAFSKDGTLLVGQAAKNQRLTNPTNTIYSVKRFIGRKFDELSEDDKLVSFKVIKATNGDAHIELQVDGQAKVFSPAQISGMILAKLKSDAEATLGKTINHAVIAVPAYFNESQRIATRYAGRLAGLTVVRVINEASAAALAYGFDKIENKKIAVIDVGGGGLSAAVLEISDGIFEVKATTGQSRLGSDAMDLLLMSHLFQGFFQATGIELRGNSVAFGRARNSIEQLKVNLTTVSQGQLVLPSLVTSLGQCHTLIHPLSRLSLEDMTSELIAEIIKVTQSCLIDARVKAEELSELVLIGGGARMPKLRTVINALVLRQPYLGINGDEAVAVGAAIQAGVLTGNLKDVILLDATCLTVGIETAGGIATPFIRRNTSFPTTVSQIFSTSSDNQTAISIKVVQGECVMAADNHQLGCFVINDIPPALRGVPQVQVTFDIDANGILNVTAKDFATGVESKLKNV